MLNKSLSEKVQVLLDKDDLRNINFLIFKQSYLEDTKIVSISEYIRTLIKTHIKNSMENDSETESGSEIKKVFEILQKQKNNGRK